MCWCVFQGSDYVLVCRPRDEGASLVSAYNPGQSNAFFSRVIFVGLSRRPRVIVVVLSLLALAASFKSLSDETEQLRLSMW